MKKPGQKTPCRMQRLQPQDLAAVRGGDNGTLHMDTTIGGGGAAPSDNGVIHMQTVVAPLDNGVLHMG